MKGLALGGLSVPPQGQAATAATLLLFSWSI